jgi:hypothetical protein
MSIDVRRGGLDRNTWNWTETRYGGFEEPMAALHHGTRPSGADAGPAATVVTLEDAGRAIA